MIETAASKSIAIAQSNYIPWKGYFDLIRRVDEFVLFDDTQFTRRDWRNRNRIKVAGGTAWLTIPVRVKGRFRQNICETAVSDPDWAAKHWKSIRHWYRKAPCFGDYGDFFEDLYRGCRETELSQINHGFLSAICGLLGITTRLSWSMDYDNGGEAARTERLVEICRQARATEYLSGPSARAYLDIRLFERAGIQVRWMDYSGYPAYRQLFPPFIHEVSVIDLLLCEGSDAIRFMKDP